MIRVAEANTAFGGHMSYQRVGNKSRVWSDHVSTLRRAWAERRLVLCLGAGVSVPYGLPDWRDLVLGLIIKRGPELAERRKGIDWEEYNAPYQKALGRWLMSRFRFDPVRLSRLLEDDGERFLRSIRDELYAPLRRAAKVGLLPATPNSLTAVADLLARPSSPSVGGQVRSVLSFNFDDLLERELTRRGLQHTPAFDARSARTAGNDAGRLPVYHVHGYLPQDGDVPRQQLVFQETSFHEVTTSIQHWGAKKLIRHLQQDVVLFVGISFEDPNLRRLLDACYDLGADPQHFRITLDFEIGDDEKTKAEREIEEWAENLKTQTGWRSAGSPPDLRAALEEMGKQAHVYDRNAMKTLGVRTVWVKDYADVPAVLEHVFGK